MTAATDSREHRKAQLLWSLVEQLRHVDDPEDMTIIAILSPEFVDLIGVMEVAAQAYTATQKKTGNNRRLEAARGSLLGAIDRARLTEETHQ